MSEATIEEPHTHIHTHTPPPLCLFGHPSVYLSLSCQNSALYQYITWFIWQPDHRFVFGMQASGRENSLFVIQQRLRGWDDAVVNWKMNKNWQDSQGNQSDRKGFQYGNAGEMITWKRLQHIFLFFFRQGVNELVCPMGLTTCIRTKF